MPDVFEIVKRRWPEVALVVVFKAGLTVLMGHIQHTMLVGTEEEVVQMRTPAGVAFLLGLGIAACMIIVQMLQFGFLATAHSEGSTPQSPEALLRAGRYFFWRMFRFHIMFALVYYMLWYILLKFLGASGEGGVSPWMQQLTALAAMAILIKPMLMVPAVMITQDKMVMESFAVLGRYRLTEASGLIKCFIAYIVVMFLFLGLDTLGGNVVFDYTVTGISSVVSGTFFLMLYLFAVRFIAVKDAELIEPV